METANPLYIRKKEGNFKIINDGDDVSVIQLEIESYKIDALRVISQQFGGQKQYYISYPFIYDGDSKERVKEKVIKILGAYDEDIIGKSFMVACTIHECRHILANHVDMIPVYADKYSNPEIDFVLSEKKKENYSIFTYQLNHIYVYPHKESTEEHYGVEMIKTDSLALLYHGIDSIIKDNNSLNGEILYLHVTGVNNIHKAYDYILLIAKKLNLRDIKIRTADLDLL